MGRGCERSVRVYVCTYIHPLISVVDANCFLVILGTGKDPRATQPARNILGCWASLIS